MNLRDGSLRSKTILAAMAFAIQLVILGSIIVPALVTTSSGQTVRLAVAPVDPRDPLRGDYLAVAYDISTLTDTEQPSGLKKGQVVWMPLKQNGAVWDSVEPLQTQQPSRSELALLGATAAIRGTVSSLSPRTIDYGIDRYFVAEGKGTSFPAGQVIAQVKLGTDGKAVLQKIYVNGRVWP